MPLKPVPTPQERRLAAELQILIDKGKLPYQFEVQYQIQNRFADIAFPQIQLIFEVEGSVHYTEDVHKKDRFRQNTLAIAGWTVLTVPNSRIDRNPEKAAWKVLFDINDFVVNKSGSPLPAFTKKYVGTFISPSDEKKKAWMKNLFKGNL